MGNAATGFFVVFSLIAGVVGAASAINGINHIRSSRKESSSSAQSSAIIAWTLTLLAMGLANVPLFVSCRILVVKRASFLGLVCLLHIEVVS